MRFLNGLLIIAVVAFMTACGGGAKTNNTEGTDSTSTTETANTDNTEKKNDETSSTETKGSAAILTASKWMMDVDAMVAKMPEEEAKNVTDEVKANMAKGRFVFEAGGVMKMVSPAGTEEPGTWKLSEDGKTFTITQGEGDKAQETVNKVVELTAEKIVFEYQKGDKTQYMILKPATAESTEGTTETKEGEKKEGEKKDEEKKEGEKTEEKK